MANVLIVDDEEVYRTYISNWLAREGHEVRSASNRQEAALVAKSFCPDLLIVDFLLKDEYYGLQVAEAMRELAPELRIIVITGYPSDSLRRDALDAHVFRVIDKPFHMIDLADAVRDAVNLHTEAGPRA
jgi:DNA-binding NtrC family response regulator